MFLKLVMKYQYILSLILLGITLGGGGGAVYASVDRATVGDDVALTVHRGSGVVTQNTGDGITAIESVPEFSSAAMIVMGIAITGVVIFAAKAMPKFNL